MEEAAQKISKRQAAKMLTFSASGAELREKLEFLEHVITERQVRLLVVSCFEFAAANARQKHALVHWLRRMRDDHALRIVVYSVTPERPQQGGHFGALALLAWTADLIRHIRSIDDARDFSEPPNANQTLLEALAEMESGETCFSLSPRREAESPLDPTQDTALSPHHSPDPDPDPDPQSSVLSPQSSSLPDRPRPRTRSLPNHPATHEAENHTVEK